jgi:hypothetical protein
MMTRVLAVAIIFTILISSSSALAGDRKFTYAYESTVLPIGVRELEIWNTYRRDRSYFYRRLDQRTEFEVGVAPNLQTSFYLNTEWKHFDDNGNTPGGNSSSSVGVSFSNEWKLKLADRVADPMGFALYGEWTLGPDETELEGKLILDKQTGPLLLAFNLVGEQEWETELVNGVEETGKELKLQLVGGVSYDVTREFALGLEARNINTYLNGDLAISTLFAGPAISYTAESWWATITFLPQVTAFKGATNGRLNLDDHEKVEARLLFSFHL